MTARSGFLTCSNEVLTMIFNNPSLEKKDIKSLRLTSKELYPAATREFAKRYLTEPFFTLTQSGLHVLVDICKHPIFGPQIRSIGFLAATLDIKGLEHRVHHLARVESLVDGLAEISEYSGLCKEQLELEASGGQEKLLVDALEAIGHSISIKVTNNLKSVKANGVIGLPAISYHYGESSGTRW
jgi:hypothetical protein